jgi:hypothetical protein
MKLFHVYACQEANPEISENGLEWKSVSPEELDKILVTLKKNKDVAIVYSREDASRSPSNTALRVFKIIEAARIPTKLVRSKGSDGTGESEPDGEPSYANCLLVTLARSPGKTALLKSGQSVPNLETIATDPKDLAWIYGMPFNYTRLNSDIVMKIIFSVKGSLQPNLIGETKEIIARMALSPCKSEVVRFQLRRTPLKEELQQLEIKCLVP